MLLREVFNYRGALIDCIPSDQSTFKARTPLRAFFLGSEPDLSLFAAVASDPMRETRVINTACYSLPAKAFEIGSHPGAGLFLYECTKALSNRPDLIMLIRALIARIRFSRPSIRMAATPGCISTGLFRQ